MSVYLRKAGLACRGDGGSDPCINGGLFLFDLPLVLLFHAHLLLLRRLCLPRKLGQLRLSRRQLLFSFTLAL